MDNFKNEYESTEFENNEINTNEAETETENTDEASENYTWYDDEYKTAMSGTISESNALSVYKPKIKKPRGKNVLLTAVISSVVTTAICCGIFMAVLTASGVIKTNNATAPEGNTLSISENGDAVIKTVVNSADADALTLPEIYSKTSPSVVGIICTSNNGFNTATSSGSGVIITKDGYIATNNHVIEGATIITVKTFTGKTYDAQLIGSDERTDLAVLKISPDQEMPAAEVGNSTELRVGDMAIAIGNPLREELASTLTVGYISAINRTMVIDERQMTLLQTDAAINPGNSGGALINVYGQVIGITTAKSIGYDVEGLGFAIPMSEAVPIIESIIKNGYVTGRPLVGITGIDVTEQISKANNIPMGVYVYAVAEGGSAATGGIQRGDVIIKCDGKEVKTVDDINQIRDEHKVGDEIVFVVSRNGKEIKCKIVLQEEKPSQKKQEVQQEPVQYGIPSDFFSFFGW